MLQPYEAMRILSVPVYCPECVSTDTELYTFFNKLIFVFFVHKSYSCSFIKLRLNQWCYVEYFINFLTSFLGLGCGSCVALHTALRLWVGNNVRVNNWWQNFHFLWWTVHLRLVLLFFFYVESKKYDRLPLDLSHSLNVKSKFMQLATQIFSLQQLCRLLQ